MRYKIALFFSMGLTLLLLPYLMVIIVNGAETCMMIRQPQLEDCLLWAVYLQEQQATAKEAEKAEAVIARTNFYYKLSQGMELIEFAGNLWKEVDKRELFWVSAKIYQRLYQALDDTSGEILLCKGKLEEIPYHKCSAGRTRDGGEAFYQEESCFLAVESPWDRNAPDYLTAVFLDAEQFPAGMEVTKTDSSGYVQEMSVDGEILGGEIFREEMGLPSGNFSIQDVGDRIRILCKGQGHGLGYSQYGGNALAAEGKTYADILMTYFPDFTLEG